MSDDLKFVIIGSGNMSRTYISAVQKVNGARVVGIVSRSGNKPENLEDESVVIAKTLGAIEVEFDAVMITTPNGLHGGACLAAAELGKHVLTEKVLEIDAGRMDAMIAACKAKNLKLGVAFQRRMSPDNRVVKGLISEGKLGRIFAVDLVAKFYRDQAYYDSAAYRGGLDIDGGGPFVQQSAHNVDIYAWFFGMPKKVVSMLDTFTHEMEGEDHGAALMLHEDGMIGTIIASTATIPGYCPKMTIHSDKGSLVLENDVITEWHFDDMPNPSQAGTEKIHSGASAAVTDTAGHEAIIWDFIAAVREDREPDVSGEKARVTTDLILAIYNNKAN
jgi:UDP-N-acetyl-2-amino-2-deoxyglucuronate dehydrogenase